MKTLKNQSEFNKIYHKGKKILTKHFIVYVYFSTISDEKKYGIAIKKKVGNAVTRNRIRRIIKHCLNLNETKFKLGTNFLLIPRYSIAQNAENLKLKVIGDDIIGSLKKNRCLDAN